MLLDARGLVSFVTLNIASDLQIINGDTYFVLISMTLFTTAISWPCFSLFYKERAPVE
jgi:Kef-type K+ transport system membrane component KefB